MSAEKIVRAAQKIVDWQIDCNHLLKASDGSTAPVVPFNVAKRIITEELADSILITREQLERVIELLPKLVPKCQPHEGKHNYVNWHEEHGGPDYATCSICDKQFDELMYYKEKLTNELRALGEKRG